VAVEAWRKLPMGENTRRSDDRVGALYAAYQDWRTRVYEELDRLSADELDSLGRLLRGDTRQLLDRIDDALARALPTRKGET